MGPPNHLRFGGGGLSASSPAFLFVPKPNATLDRSFGPGVPPCEGESTADDEILENPGRGAGDAELLLGPIDEKPEGPGLFPFIIA